MPCFARAEDRQKERRPREPDVEHLVADAVNLGDSDDSSLETLEPGDRAPQDPVLLPGIVGQAHSAERLDLP